MKRISFYGSSDDLVEVEGELPGCDEYPSEEETFLVAGLLVTVSYSPGGVWEISVRQVEEDLAVTAENLRLSVQPRFDGEPGYSMRLDMDVPETEAVRSFTVESE